MYLTGSGVEREQRLPEILPLLSYIDHCLTFQGIFEVSRRAAHFPVNILISLCCDVGKRLAHEILSYKMDYACNCPNRVSGLIVCIRPK